MNNALQSKKSRRQPRIWLASIENAAHHSDSFPLAPGKHAIFQTGYAATMSKVNSAKLPKSFWKGGIEMKSRVSSLAQRIKSIKEEFSENEIRRALKLLEQESSSSPLFADLASAKGQGAGSRHEENKKTKIKDLRQ